MKGMPERVPEITDTCSWRARLCWALDYNLQDPGERVPKIKPISARRYIGIAS